MASIIYRPFIHSMLSAGTGHAGYTPDLLDVTTDIVSLILVDSGTYTVDKDHDFYDDVTAGGIVSGSSTAMVTPVLTDGGTSGVKWDASDFNAAGAGSLTGVGDGVDAVSAIVIWVNVNGGTSASDPLVAYIDTGTGFGVIPSSSTVDIVWHADGIFNFNYA